MNIDTPGRTHQASGRAASSAGLVWESTLARLDERLKRLEQIRTIARCTDPWHDAPAQLRPVDYRQAIRPFSPDLDQAAEALAEAEASLNVCPSCGVQRPGISIRPVVLPASPGDAA